MPEQTLLNARAVRSAPASVSERSAAILANIKNALHEKSDRVAPVPASAVFVEVGSVSVSLAVPL